MKIPFIPKSLLKHSITYEEKNTHDVWGKNEYAPEIIIFNVKVENRSDLVKSSQERNETFHAVVYIDAELSKPKSSGFVKDSIVKYKGVRYRIAEVSEFYDPFSDNLHHTRLGLITSRK